MNDEEKVIAGEVVREIERIKKDLDDGLESKDYATLEEKVRSSAEILDELSAYCKEVVGPDRILSMSLNVFLKECISQWKKKFWSIDIIGKSEGSLQIECSKVRLKRSIEHLILNSMEAGASEVIINVTSAGIEVIDDGDGISPEDTGLIKEKGTTKEGRQGLGLKLVKGMFTPMGWQLKMANNSPSGLKVSLLKS